MESIDKRTLNEILVKNGYSLTLCTGEGEEITVDCVLTYVADGEAPCFKCTGYVVCGKEEKEVGSEQELYDYLKNIGAGDGEYNLVTILGGRYDTVAEMRAQIAFDHISMEDLLKRYSDADRFSLTAYYGDVHIEREVADEVLRESQAVMRSTAKGQYDCLSEEEKKVLPPFDELYEEIFNECLAYRKRNAKRVEERDGNAFFCDRFALGKGKYKAPMALWHIYNAVDMAQFFAYRLDKLVAIKKVAPIDRQLEGLSALKEALISAKPTFSWHCTTGSELSTVFTFALNEKTRAWLLTHKDDYDFGTTQAGYVLDDLALYRGDKILFSSCTHERFHVDCSDEQKGE